VKGAALSDLHLGFRAFPSVTGGRNTREQDVEAAWRTAVDQIIATLEPGEVVTIAGDIFHHPRVSDFAKKAFLDGVRRLLAHGLVVIILQGNHDAGRTADVLTPIMLAEGMGERLYVVTEPERIRVCIHPKDKGAWVHPDECEAHVSVACFPFVTRAAAETYRLDPDPEADFNILVMHAAVNGDAGGDTLPYFYGGDQALDVGREADRWDVIHCGDYHEFRRLHPTRCVFYPGSIERTSSNIWAEEAPKGWVLWDVSEGTMEFREIPGRPMRDIEASWPMEGPSAEVLNLELSELAEDPEIAGAIVRLKVDDFPKAERDHIDQELVRKLRGICTHFYLDLRYAKAEFTDIGDRRDRERGMTLAAEANAFFAEDPEDVRSLAIGYLGIEADVEEVEEAEEVAL
jgi:DNA repair exonuclease SbcCD nuclease subunit